MMKKLLAVVLAFTMLMLVACGQGGSTQTETAPEIAVLYTNDAHTYIDGPISYDVIAGLKAELAKEYDMVLLVDAGDHSQGTVYGSTDFGESVIKLMNLAGYDAATLGNHEFDYSMVGTMNMIEWAEFPYISANFHKISNGEKGETVLDAYTIFECGTEKIAFVGITTPASITSSTPAYFQDENGNFIYGISGGEDGVALYADVQAAVDAAKEAGATKVIALGHLGDEETLTPWRSEDVIRNVSGLDAFIDGHSHSIVEAATVTGKDGKAVALTQTGEYLDRVGLMVIGETITTDFIEAEEILETVKDENGEVVVDEDGEEVTEVVGYKFASDLYKGAEWVVDEEVKSAKDAWIGQVQTELGAVIGTTALTFDNYDAEGNRLVRKQSTNTGDFAADALYYLFDGMELDVDVAIMNGGGVRNKAITGDISFLTCKEIHTFGNVACLQTVTGQQLLDVLEWGAQATGTGESGGFIHVAGAVYSIDTAIEPSVQKDENGIWTGGPVNGYKVHDVKIYNKATGEYEDLDLTAEYNLAGYNYTLRDMGDGCNMFKGSVNVVDYVMEDYMVLANYILGFENYEIGAENSPLLSKYDGMLLNYGETTGSGRITIK